MVLFSFAGCAGMREFFVDITEKNENKNHKKSPEGTQATPCSCYLKKALEYEKKDDLQTALFYMQIAGTLNPDSNKIPEKIADLKSTIKCKAQRHFTKGVKFFQKRRFKDARRQFLTTLRYSPGHKEALDYLKNRLLPKETLNYKVKGKETLQAISKEFYQDPSKDFLIAYFNNLKTGNPAVSGTILKIPVLKSNLNPPPFDTRIELIKAKNLLKEKRYQEALDIAEKILEYDHLNKKASDLKNSAYYQMGITLSGQKKYPEAIKMFKKVAPEYQGVNDAIQRVIDNELIKGKKLLKQKQYEQVLAVAGQILDHDPSNKAAEDLINMAFCQQGKDLTIQKNYTQAIDVLNRANPQYDCVKKTISYVYKTKKKDAEVHYLKGVKHFLNEELKSAIQEWDKTLALNPEHKKAKENINNARRLLEKFEKVK
jgi:tetratricopeptide (TPR) repeat protein